ncbi:MAG: DUF4149 domain-containing protein [Burkholderiaceae bacterium]
MRALVETLRRLLPGVWCGLLVALASIAAPSAFQALDRASAGLVVRRVFESEAGVSLALGALILVIERRAASTRHAQAGVSQFSGEMMLTLGALFCTVAGYYGLLPMMEAARAGAAGRLGFAQLHALSAAFFGVKIVLVSALAWKAAR